MAKTLDLRTYLLLERAFVRRLQRSWRQQSAPIYAAITQACNDHNWDEARRLVPTLDMAEVGTENREWITYMLLSFAVFGAGTVAKGKPSFVGVGTFDTFLKQVTTNFLQYLELNATAQIQAEALQLIAEDEAKTKAVKFDPHQPRDEQGRWTDGGRTAAGLPADLPIHALSAGSVIEALGERRWDLQARPSKYHEGSYDVTIAPKLVEGVEKRPGRFRGEMYFDTRLATVTDDGDVTPTLKDGWSEEIPAEQGSGDFFRGMRYEEYQHILSTGVIGSKGDYNLGEPQVGLTFFSVDPEQAAHYSAGFAPWQHAPTFDKPAIVVRVKDPGTAKTNLPGLGLGTEERGVPGTVPQSAITDVYVGRPYLIKPGEVELYKDWDRKTGKPTYTEGSRQSPSSWVVWKRYAPGEALVLKWDPDQPRAKDGRWAKASASGAKASATLQPDTHLIKGAFSLDALRPPSREHTSRKFMMDPKSGAILMGGYRERADEPLGGRVTHAELLGNADAQGLVDNPDYDTWVRGNLSFFKDPPEISIYNKEDTGQHLPGGKGGEDAARAALFDATYKTLERFVAAGATPDTRVELQHDWSRGTLGEMFPELFRKRADDDTAVLKWEESKHPRDAEGKFTEGVGYGAEAAQADTRAGGGGGVAVSTAPAKAKSGGRPEAVPEVQVVADAYNAKHGMPPVKHEYAPLNEARAGTIADAYEALPLDDSGNAEVREAYQALAKEIRQQYDHVVASGVTFTPWTKEGQPYQNSAEMVEDIRRNKHMYFYTGGDPNEFMAARDPETGLTVNDMFRAVHDYFGHAAGGYGFGPRGEENAWMSHSQMLSTKARRALTTETRGQNSWVNFGRHNYDAEGNHKNIPPQDRPFATQKTALMPVWYALLPGETTLKWDESKHPRDEDGQFTRVAMTSQRAEGDPGHMLNKEVFRHMRDFARKLEALPGVSRVSVKPGVGGWEGGSEPMWQVYYRGNGAATKLVAATGKRFNQDAVLILKGCKKGGDCQPSTELSFQKGLNAQAREAVHAVLVANGIQGWTWMKQEGRTVLRMVSVPQWGSEAKAHQQATAKVSQQLREQGMINHRRVRRVAVSIMERKGEHSYDRVLES